MASLFGVMEGGKVVITVDRGKGWVMVGVMVLMIMGDGVHGSVSGGYGSGWCWWSPWGCREW